MVKVLIGAQWGDEGKGKIIDVLAKDADIVARYQGGNNAGHTVIVEDKKYVLHLIPSGIHSEKTANIIGNGVVLNPIGLLQELDNLKSQGVDISKRFFISHRAHLVFNYHALFDRVHEEAKMDDFIGTTQKGIGPCYADKINRIGLRAVDILSEEKFKEKFIKNINYYNSLLEQYNKETLNVEEEYQVTWQACLRLKDFICDTALLLNQGISENKNILLEGAQGIWLDIDHGTYPYVTSSNTGSGGAATGSGIAPRHITDVLGVIKAYTTRVGEGPFPSEDFSEDGKKMAKIGNEFGATTGRPRRCGWFDAVASKYAVLVHGINQLALTKLDVLDTFAKIKICVAYKIDGKTSEVMPVDFDHNSHKIEPIYEELDGWQQSTEDIRDFNSLPINAQKFLHRIEELIQAKITIISVGPKRESTFMV